MFITLRLAIGPVNFIRLLFAANVGILLWGENTAFYSLNSYFFRSYRSMCTSSIGYEHCKKDYERHRYTGNYCCISFVLGVKLSRVVIGWK